NAVAAESSRAQGCRRVRHAAGRGRRRLGGRGRAVGAGRPRGPRAAHARQTAAITQSQEEIVIKILTPVQPAPVMEIAKELLPPGMELLVVDPTKPEFYDAAGDATYYLGSPRFGIGNEFFRAAPKLKLVQLTSAGYDRVDLEAARKAKVPVANNGGANSVAV